MMTLTIRLTRFTAALALVVTGMDLSRRGTLRRQLS